jgi:UDP-N-acetylglucosamine:LPS N-acetylglucosamine transferase
LPIQLVVVTGDAEELLDDIRGIDWQIPAHIYGLVPDFPLFLRAADAIITKAGGLTVAEALGAGTPLFITQSLPLYERGNAAYVVQYGAGRRISKLDKLGDAVQNSLAENGRILREMSLHATEIGRPRAAYDAAEQIWALFVDPHREGFLAIDN